MCSERRLSSDFSDFAQSTNADFSRFTIFPISSRHKKGDPKAASEIRFFPIHDFPGNWTTLSLPKSSSSMSNFDLIAVFAILMPASVRL